MPGNATGNAIQSAYTAQIATVIAPSGDTTGVTDVKRINAALAAGQPVQLLQASLAAPYYINSPILPVSQSRLWGAQWWSASQNDFYSAGAGESGGTVILMVAGSGFTAGTAAIQMVNSTSNQYFGVDLAGFTIEGFTTGGSGCYGLLVDGAWGACFLRGVCIHRPDSDCAHFTFDATTGDVPDDWLISECKFSASRNGNGVYASFLDDSWILGCESSENNLAGWYMIQGSNTRMADCKGENNGTAGFRFGGLGNSEFIDLIGCTTNLNQQDGFLFDNSGSGGAGFYILTGCRASEDGQAGGTTYGGFRSAACLSQVAITGGGVIPNGTGPAYGASQTGSAIGINLTGTILSGITAATHDDGTNTNPLISLLPPYGRSLGTGIAGGIVTLTDAATIAVNAALGNDYHVTLGGNRTLGAPTNPTDRQIIRIDVIQPASGGPWTLAYNAIYDFGAAGSPTLSTGANKVDTLAFRYVASITKWTYLGSGLNF